MIMKLSEVEIERDAMPALNKLFVDSNPYEAPFAPQIESRMILYPYTYFPDPLLLDSIVATAQLYGDTGFYMTFLETIGSDPEDLKPHNWFVPFTDALLYSSKILPLSNVMYSPQGLWGLIGSAGWHGIFGGDTLFMHAIQQHIPHLEQEVYAFLDNWKEYQDDENTDISWILPLIYHIYGEEKGRQLLADAHFIP